MQWSLVLLVALVALFAEARRHSLNCEPSNTYLYKYRAEASSFGGNGKNSEENSQASVLTADVAIACHQSFKVQGGKKTHVYSFNVNNVRMRDRKPTKKAGWVKERNNQEASPVNLDAQFSKPTFATINEDGKILKLFSDNNEEVWVKHMKKGIVDMVNSKLNGGVREDVGMMGSHKSTYTKKVDATGAVRVSRKWDQDDFLTPRFNPRESTVKGEATVVVNNGQIVLATTTRKAVLGVNPKKHKIFKRKSNAIGFKKGERIPMKKVAGKQGTFTDSTSAASLILNKVVPFRKYYAKMEDYFTGVSFNKAILPVNATRNTVFSKRPIFVTREHVHAHGLEFEEDMELHMDAVRANRLRNEINLTDELFALYKNPDDASLRAKLGIFVKHHPKSSLSALKAAFQVAQKEKKIDYLKVLQSLMISVGTPEAQEDVLETLVDSELKQHFLVNAISIRKPTDKIIQTLRNLQKGDTTLSDTDEENENLKNLAYMVTADVISRSDNTALQQEVIDEMVDKLYNEEEPEAMVMHLHALGNAKSATPITYWRRLLSNKEIPPQVQTLIIQGLEHRVELGKDEADVTKLLHDVLSSDHFEPDVKAAAVNVQNKRHRALGLSTSMYYLGSLYPDADEKVQKEIYEYLYDIGNKRAAYVMSTMTDNVEVSNELRDEMRRVMMSDVKFFRRIGRAFRRVGRAIGGAVRRVGHAVRRAARAVGRVAQRVGRAVGRAAKAVGKGVVKVVKFIGSLPAKIANAFSKLKKAFSSAKFKNEKTCVPASQNPGDNICAHDSELIQFAQGQGDLSNLKYVKHFEFEKLIGSEVVHLYIGMLGYAGVRLSCTDPRPGIFEFSTFAMGKAYAKVFSKDIKLITAQASFGKLYDTPARNDAFVKIGGAVLFNKNILPEAVTRALDYCNSKTSSLIKKSYPELVNVKFAFVLVVFPVEFGFGVQAEFGVDASMSLCIGRQEASVSIEPYFSVGINGYGSLSIIIAKGGLQLRAELNYRLIPKLYLEKCQVCAELRHQVKPITFFVDAFVMFLHKKWQKTLLNFGTNPIDASLFKYCIGPKPKALSDASILSIAE